MTHDVTINLYNTVLDYTQDRSYPVDRQALARVLSLLPAEHAEVAQVLILHHNMRQGQTEATPYHSLLIKKDVLQYDLNKLDDQLIQILLAYVTDLAHVSD